MPDPPHEGPEDAITAEEISGEAPAKSSKWTDGKNACKLTYFADLSEIRNVFCSS
jgi:hypothetical protein